MEGREVREEGKGLNWNLGTDHGKVSKGRAYAGEIMGRCKNNGKHKTGPIVLINHLETDLPRDCPTFI